MYSDTLSSWIGYSTDGVNWNKLFDTDINAYCYTVDVTSKGLVAFFQRYYDSSLAQIKIYLVDVKSQKTILLLSKDVSAKVIDFIYFPLLRFYNIYGDRIFYSDYLDSIPYVCDVSEGVVPKWERTRFFDTLFKYFGWENVNFQPRSFYISSDSMFFFFVSISNKGYLVRVFMQDSNISNVEDDGGNGVPVNKLFVQTLPPFPQPASSYVKAKIYIEGFQEIKPEYFKFYDINGMLTHPIKISVEKLSPFLFEATYDVSSLPNGVYFVRYTKSESPLMFGILVYR